MDKILLLGYETQGMENKRTHYFLKAASQLGVAAEFCDIRSVNKEALRGSAVKIDPIFYDSCEIGALNSHATSYIKCLQKLKCIPAIKFLNTPDAIVSVLSKENCKKVLMNNNIGTTEVLAFNLKNRHELKEKMTSSKILDVFIKPNFGAGAAGVAAYRFHPKFNREILYTSAFLDGEGHLNNTKRVIKYEDTATLEKIIDKILQGPSIVERWHPKAKHLDFSYDLRVVVQFGKVDFIVGRLSKNPITNLHLNNNAISLSSLGLSMEKLSEVESLCCKAVGLFPGLNVAGVDLLLTRNTLTPLIIEINAQGDLIYQDIYNENLIYKKQILEMRRFNE